MLESTVEMFAEIAYMLRNNQCFVIINDNEVNVNYICYIHDQYKTIDNNVYKFQCQ